MVARQSMFMLLADKQETPPPLSQMSFNLWECYAHQHPIGQRWSHGQPQGVCISTTPGCAGRRLSWERKTMKPVAIFHSLGWMSSLWLKLPRMALSSLFAHHITKSQSVPLTQKQCLRVLSCLPLFWALVELMHSEGCLSTWLTDDEQNLALMPPITEGVFPVSPSVLLNLAQNGSPEPKADELRALKLQILLIWYESEGTERPRVE